MKTWFSSDMHFGDNRLGMFYRPFSDVREQHSVIIDNWNRIVGVDDIVWILGDVSVTDEHVKMLDKLNGIKHLIIGNYDETRLEVLRPYFNSVQDNKIIQLYNGESVYLNHYPKKAVANMLNLVGHIHSLWKVQRNMINVSTDAWNFMPVSEEQIVFCINAIKGVQS